MDENNKEEIKSEEVPKENMQTDFRPVNRFSSLTGEPLPEPKELSKTLFLVVGIIVLVLIGGSAFLLRGKFQKPPVEEPKEPAVQISSPPVTPEPSFDRSKFTVRVLNGTKKTGLAASVSAKLKELGYKTEKEGNATSSAILRTEVRVKEEATGLLEQLIKDLSPDFDATSGALLKASDVIDGEVILGVK